MGRRSFFVGENVQCEHRSFWNLVIFKQKISAIMLKQNHGVLLPSVLFSLNVMFMFLSNWEQSMTLHVVMFPGSLWFGNVWKLKLLRFFNSRSKHLWTCQKLLSNYCCVVFTSEGEYATPNHLREVSKTRRLLWVPSWVQLLRDGKFLVQQWGESECCFAISLIWWPVCACVWHVFSGVKVAKSDTHAFMISSSHPFVHQSMNPFWPISVYMYNLCNNIYIHI